MIISVLITVDSAGRMVVETEGPIKGREGLAALLREALKLAEEGK